MSNTYSAGIATAYGAAVRGGYTGTYDEWCALMADYATVGEQAAQSAQAAQESAANAAESETAAATSESNAATSATSAGQSATAAAASEAAAQTAEANTAASATDAAGSATAAATSATNAAASEAAARAVEESIPADYTALSEDVSDLKSQMGDLADLDTTDKSSLVAAINEAAQSGGGGDVTDVQVNGVSVVQDGVANVPLAGLGAGYGVVKLVSGNGIGFSGGGNLMIVTAISSAIKNGTNSYTPITPYNQAESTFYGLAKAAGDTTQSESSNAVGAYTDEAKAAIQSMLDVPASAEVEGLQDQVDQLENTVGDLKSAITTVGDGYYPLPIINNSRVSLSGLIVENQPGWQRTDYMDVSGYSVIKVIAPSATSYTVFFKSDKTFDSQKALAVGTNAFAVPSTAKYYMMCIQGSNLGSFLMYANDKYKIEVLEEEITDVPQLESVNLFNKDTITPDSFINYTNGNVQATTVGACASDWIPCKPSTTYIQTNSGNTQTNSCAFYTADKTYISGISTGGARAPYTFTTPENAAYMRWTVYNVAIDGTQIAEGVKELPYSPYQKAVKISDINLIALENALQNVVTVGATGCDYTSILEALSSTPESVKVIVTPGTYNIADEYTAKYGSSYWTNYAGYATTNPFDRGLWVNNGRKITLEAGAKLVFNLDGSTTVKNQFSVFATGYNAHIEGGCIDIGQNLCRYAIHDDWGSQNGTNVFKNIVFVGSPVSQSHIGGGMGYHLNYRIENCIFLNNSGACDISYHNNLSAEAENKLEVTGCYGSKKCVFRWYGNSTKISYAVVHDCHFSEIYAEPHPTATPNTNVNVQLIAFCNETNA